ncbi:MAG: helix-turn-helix transcriptional regulator [Firmicutes bacterium]|nr:helix-turn-helix transcriptional regulator [Bacillota bacterium]
MALYKRIKNLREDSDKTQHELAEYLGTTAQYYGKYEKGERELPFSRAIQIAEFYNVSLDYLAEKSNCKQSNYNFTICHDDLNFIQQYLKLSEKNKGKLELFLDMLLKKQNSK